ncbi:MAG TPA: TIGR02300 family protein [Methylocella sp.]|nr:TIGR02300 family protein [Methylocella sp.]
MAKPELGNKHHCQNCGTRFFDLNKSPVVCPKCGTVSQAVPLARAAQPASSVEEEEAEGVPVAELVSLEEADAGEDKVAVTPDDEVEIEPADDDFLEEEEEDNDDVGDLIDGEIGEEEER